MVDDVVARAKREGFAYSVVSEDGIICTSYPTYDGAEDTAIQESEENPEKEIEVVDVGSLVVARFLDGEEQELSEDELDALTEVYYADDEDDEDDEDEDDEDEDDDF